MNLDELKLEKSSKLLDLEAAKRKGDNRSVYKLGSEAAALEGVIARAYTSSGENEKAVINLILVKPFVYAMHTAIMRHSVFLARQFS